MFKGVIYLANAWGIHISLKLIYGMRASQGRWGGAAGPPPPRASADRPTPDRPKVSIVGLLYFLAIAGRERPVGEQYSAGDTLQPWLAHMERGV